MRILFTLIALLFLSSHAAAQSPNTYKVNPGEQVMYALPANVVRIYPEFRQGQVQFRNGRVGGGMMNYSNLLEEMEFINGADTLALADIESVKHIVFEKDTFYRVQKFFVRQLAINGEFRLCERRAVVMTNRERYGGHGEVQQGSSVLAVEQLSNSVNPLRRMVAKELMTFSLDKTYYFSDRFGNLKLASKRNLVDMYGKQYPGLENFLLQNKFNYTREEDMRLVLEFLNIDEQRKR